MGSERVGHNLMTKCSMTQHMAKSPQLQINMMLVIIYISLILCLILNFIVYMTIAIIFDTENNNMKYFALYCYFYPQQNATMFEIKNLHLLHIPLLFFLVQMNINYFYFDKAKFLKNFQCWEILEYNFIRPFLLPFCSVPSYFQPYNLLFCSHSY